MKRKLRKTEIVVEDADRTSSGNSQSPAEISPASRIMRYNPGPNSVIGVSKTSSYSPKELEEGRGIRGQIEEARAVNESVAELGRQHRTIWEKQRLSKIRRNVLGIAAIIASVGGLATWAYKTLDMSKQIKAKNAVILEQNETIASYNQRFADLVAVDENVLAPLEEGVKNLEQRLGAEGIFSNFVDAIGGVRYFLNIPVRGEDNRKNLANLVDNANKLSSDLKKISNEYQVKAYSVELLKEKYPGFGLLRIGANGLDIVGQEVGPTENLLKLGPGTPHTGWDTNSVDSKEIGVYTEFRGKIVADYIDATKGRTIGIQALDITDELGRPLAIFSSHFANYSSKFPSYRLRDELDAGDLVGSLGYTGILSGLHAHQEARVGVKINPKTGEVTKWEQFDDIYTNKLRYINSVIWTLDNVPKSFQTNIIEYWQDK